MPETVFNPAPKSKSSPSTRTVSGDDTCQQSLDPDDLIAVFGDEYARDILCVLFDEVLPAREIATRLGVSRPTVYRRLNRLEDLGLVETSMEYHPEGHHRKEFTTTVDELSLSFESGELVVDGRVT